MKSPLNRIKISVKVIFFLFYCVSLQAQDTLFVTKYTLEESVNNLDSDGRNLIVRTANHLYLLGNEGFKEIVNIDLSGGRYTWMKSSKSEAGFATFNTNFIAGEKQVSKGSMGELLPGHHHPNITKGRKGNSLFINYRGSVLEYQVNGFYKIEHKGRSVRCVYNDDTIKITSTYSGVFADKKHWTFSEVPIPGGDYSNGEICKIRDKYYLCKDDIMVLENKSWRKVNKSMIIPAFRKLNEHDDQVFFLSARSVGIIDLESGRVVDTIFESPVNLHDFKWVNGRLMIAGEDGYLYFLDAGREPQKILVGSCVYDINVNGQTAILSCQNGVYQIDLPTRKITKLFDLTEAVQSLYVERELLVTTFNGLYVIHDKKLYNLFPNVEFNKLALSQWDDVIFAGSIQGLYVINRGQLLYDILPGLTPYEIKTTTPSTYIYVLLASLAILFGILYFTIRKRQKKLKIEIIKKTKITPERIRQVMLDNEKIISVESVAEYFATSTVQLNRILKKYNTSGLNVMKEVKGEIIRSMIERRASLDQISNRVGYSIPYVKRNYLKNMD